MTAGHKIRFLSGNDVKKCLPMKDAVEAMKEAFVRLSSGGAVVPQRTHLDLPESKGTALFMPVYVPESSFLGIKFLTLHEDNHLKDLPLIHALVIAIDSNTGKPLAIMDGSEITAIRTGAGSGAATDVLARNDADTAAIFGAGRQGRTQIEAVCAVRDVTKVYVFDVDEIAVKNFCSEMSAQLNIEVLPGKSEELLSEADIICTATTSSNPVFKDKYIQQGTHINAVGIYKTNKREIPGKTVSRASLFVDKFEAALEEAGDFVIPMNDGLITKEKFDNEIGHVISEKTLGRKSENDITIFKSVGNAIQDAMAAEVVIRIAEELGVGTEVKM